MTVRQMVARQMTGGNLIHCIQPMNRVIQVRNQQKLLATSGHELMAILVTDFMNGFKAV